MKSTEYLSAARTTSLLVLLLVYVALDQSMSFYRSSQWLHDSRDAFAEAFALDLVNGGEVAGITAIEKHQTGVRSCTADTTTPVFRVTVVRLDQRRWQSDQAWCTGKPTLEHLTGQVRRVARQLHLDVGAMPTMEEMFGEVEHKLIDERVDIGALGFALRADLAPWVIGPIVVGLLALMRNNLRAVRNDREHALEEPWLVVDAGVGVERLIASLWLASIVAAPWVSGASILAAFASRVYADGSITTPLTDVTLVAVSLGVLVAGGWLALTVASDLLALRERRLDGSADVG